MSKTMWKVAAGKGGYLFDLFKERGLVAMGLAEPGDISELTTRRQVSAKLRECFPHWPSGRVAVWAGMLFRFQHKIAIGDWALTYDPGRRKYLLGTFSSESSYDTEQVEGNPLLRKVDWTTEFDRDALSTLTRNSLGAISTLFRVPDVAAKEILSIVSGSAPAAEAADAEIDEELQAEFRLAEIEAQALEFMKDLIARLDWEQLQELVAGLLRAMGYKTRVSARGADRGKDVVASPDGFGFENPRIVVEVKHRAQSMGAQDIRSFLGGRHADDKGLYVSTGGFTKDAYNEAERASIPMTLMSLDDLVEAILEQYEHLDIETQRLVPLKRIYWPV